MVDYPIGIVTVIGGNCAIRRKGKALKLTDDRETDTMDLGKRPEIQDGDILVAGKKSAFTVSSNPDAWKPYDKKNPQRTKMMTILPNSEARVKAEVWKGRDERSDQDIVSSHITELELVKGSFLVSFTGVAEGIITPTAIITPKGEFAGLMDIHSSGLYVFKGFGSFEAKNRKTGKVFLEKGKFQDEVIVTGDAIYRKPLTKMDPSPMGMMLTPIGGIGEYKDSKEMAGKQANAMQNFGSTADQVSVGMELMKRLTPEQIAAMGGGMTPEQQKKLAEGMAQLKKMQQSGKLDEAMKAMEIGRAHMEGMGKDNIAKLQNLQERNADKIKEATKGIEKNIMKAESPREYGPLLSEFKVA